jgi:uncharacterized membrane protein YkvA (DUF1232 family)
MEKIERKWSNNQSFHRHCRFSFDFLIHLFQQKHPNYGEVLMRGYLLSLDVVVPRQEFVSQLLE